MKVFIDTSAFIAHFVKQEAYHGDVDRRLKFYLQQKVILLTSDYVLDELLTWFSAKLSKYELEKLIAGLEEMQRNDELRVLLIDPTIFKKAQEVLVKFCEHKISFTDATTYVLFKNFKLDEILTLDRDFKKMRLKTSF